MVSATNSAGNESAIKYFLIQVISGLLYLESIVSSLNLEWLLVIAILLKLGLAPFHFWVPHVFVGLAYPMLGVVSTLIKIPGLLLIQHRSNPLVWFSVLLSILVGRLGGVFLRNFKKILAYSRIRHGGWLLAIRANPLGWFYYLVIYRLVLFIFLDITNKIYIKGVAQTPKLGRVEIQIRWVVLTLSLAGLPPLLGFSAKWLVLTGLVGVNGWVVIILAVLFSFSLFYYTQIFILALLTGAKPSKQKESFSSWIKIFISFILTPFILSFVELI